MEIKIILTDIEARILGSLMEKSLSTPEYYPLSLNAMTNACNQKSSREPVTDYSEAEVERGAAQLIDKELVHLSQVGRVPKYEELLSPARKFVPAETSVLCVLLLRGAQTLGEIRTRTARMHDFTSLEEVQSTLADLEGWGLVHRLERRAGHKESRFSHGLKGVNPSQTETPVAVKEDAHNSAEDQRLDELEKRVLVLEDLVTELRAAFRDFKAQFE